MFLNPVVFAHLNVFEPAKKLHASKKRSELRSVRRGERSGGVSRRGPERGRTGPGYVFTITVITCSHDETAVHHRYHLHYGGRNIGDRRPVGQVATADVPRQPTAIDEQRSGEEAYYLSKAQATQARRQCRIRGDSCRQRSCE